MNKPKYKLYSGKKLVNVYSTLERAKRWKKRLTGNKDFPTISKNLKIKKIK